MPRTKEQFMEMREKSKRLIMETALQLFSKNGFHATSINKIAGQAGIAIGLVYNYFASKEDLLDQILKDSLADFTRLSHSRTRSALENNDLNALIDAIFELIKDKIDSWRLIISVMLQPEVAEIGRKNMEDFSNGTYLLFEAYFRSKGDDTPELKARVMEELLHAASLSFILSGDEEALELIKKEIIKKYIQ